MESYPSLDYLCVGNGDYDNLRLRAARAAATAWTPDLFGPLVAAPVRWSP